MACIECLTEATVYTRYDISSKPYAWWDVLALKLKKAKNIVNLWRLGDLSRFGVYPVQLLLYPLRISIYYVTLRLSFFITTLCQCIFPVLYLIIDG